MEQPLYQQLASLVQARLNCIRSGNTEWKFTHEDRIEKLVRDHMPSGSGLDCGTKFDFEKSTPEKLVFHTSYHHMNEAGMYDGWTDHIITVKPSLASSFKLNIGGRDRNFIKDYLYDTFDQALNTVVPQS